MNKNIITYIAIVSMAVIPTAAFAQTPSTGDSGSTGALATGNSSTTAAPSTGDSSSTATPSTGGSSSTATPSTGGSTSTATPSTGGSSSTATPSTGSSGSTATPTSNGSSNNGGSSSSSHSSSGSYSSGGGYAFAYNCQLITSYLKLGANNDSAQVLKLQNFLKNTEKIDVDANGIFDQKTKAAVMAFQNKYSTVTLAPWGLSEATGNVYITTSKKINQIACNQALMTLNTSELSLINAYKNRAQLASASGVSTGAVSTDVSAPTIQLNNDNSEIDNTVGATGDQSQNTASVNKASILERFWNFLVFLFR
jgi:hypothetical protein